MTDRQQLNATDMTTLTSPHDLLAAVPFLVGYQPTDSLVLISLHDDSIGMAMRVDFPTSLEVDQIDQLASHVEKDGADSAILVAYLPEDCPDMNFILEPLREALNIRGIGLRECLAIQSQRWRSLLCSDESCCPPTGNELPKLEESRIAVEQVAQGRRLPFKDVEAMAASLAPQGDATALLRVVKKIPEIDYEGDQVRELQREGAFAINDLIEAFHREGRSGDEMLIAKVLVRLRDLQVRDYAMGLTNDENSELLSTMWHWLLRIAPKHYVAPVATLFAALSYEKGDGALAQRALDRAFEDDATYPLAKLLRRVFAAGWPPESFARMRAELHPKICASLFGQYDSEHDYRRSQRD